MAVFVYGAPPVFTGKVSTDSWFPVRLVDATDLKTGEASIAYGDLTVKYKIAGTASAATYSIASADWVEHADGHYSMRIGAAEFTAAGNYSVWIDATATAATSFSVQVFAATIDDLVRSTTPANALTVVSGRVDVGKWLGTAVTVNATTSKPDVDVFGISSDATAADNLELITEQSRGVDIAEWNGTAVTLTGGLPDINVKSISGDSAAADTLESIIDGGANIGANILAVSDDATAASNLELIIEGTNLLSVDAIKISGDTTAADNLELFTETLSSGKLAAGSLSDDTITAASIATNAIAADGLATDAVAEIADQVWDEATSGHTTSGTFGEQLKTDVDAILADTGTDGVQIDLTQNLLETHSGLQVGKALYLALAHFGHKWTTSGGNSKVYKADSATLFQTRVITSTTEIQKGS